jgi:hypothetical protein
VAFGEDFGAGVASFVAHSWMLFAAGVKKGIARITAAAPKTFQSLDFIAITVHAKAMPPDKVTPIDIPGWKRQARKHPITKYITKNPHFTTARQNFQKKYKPIAEPAMTEM